MLSFGKKDSVVRTVSRKFTQPIPANKLMISAEKHLPFIPGKLFFDEKAKLFAHNGLWLPTNHNVVQVSEVKHI